MTRSRLFKLALPAVVALGAGTAVAIAAIPSTSDGIIHGLLRDDAGTDRRASCASSTRRRPRRRPAPPARRRSPGTRGTGPPGPQGDPGPPGDSGSRARTPPAVAASGAAARRRSTRSQTGGPSADIFLALDGIPGDSTDAQPQERDRRSSPSRSWPSARPRAPPAPRSFSGAAPGQGLRRVVAQALRRGDERAPHQERDVLTFSTGSDTAGTDVLTYKLSDVTVTSYEQGGANPDTKPLGSLEEEIGLEPRAGAGDREDVQRRRQRRPGR